MSVSGAHQVVEQVGGAQELAAASGHMPAAAAGEVGEAGPRGRGRGPERLLQTPVGMPDQHEAHRAAAQQQVRAACEESAQLGDGARCAALLRLKEAQIAAAKAGGTREGAGRGIAPHALMLHACGSDVLHRAASRAGAVDPLLLVATDGMRLIEGPGLLPPAAPHAHVGAPAVAHGVVLIAKVEFGHPAAVAPAAARGMLGIEPGDDASGEHGHLGRLLRVRGEHRVEPAGPGADVVVEQQDQLGARVRDSKVAGGVGSAGAPASR